MDLRQCVDKLRYFKEVYAAGSIHAASRKMRIAQPSVSYAIKSLEDSLATTLFFRDPKGVQLTESGIKLKRYTEEIFRLIDQADHHMREPEDPLAGTLRVGTYDIFAVHLLPIVMAKFQKALPQLRIELVINNSNAKLLEDLDNGDLHLTVMATPKSGSGRDIKTIYKESFAFFASGKEFHRCDRQWLKRRTLTVFGQAIATPGKTILEVLEQQRMLAAVRHNLPSFDAVLSFAGRGLGVALAPRILTERIIKPRSLRMVKVKGVNENDYGSQKIAIVANKRFVSDPKVIAFSQSLLYQVGI
jgi:DNA-binding transcriptional LysR family regulator